MPRTTLDLDPASCGASDGAENARARAWQVASELLARAGVGDAEVPAPDFTWISADLGRPRVDLEDPDALRRALDDTP